MNNNLTFDFTVNKETNTVHVKKEFAAGLALVWDAYTQPELLDQWWAPKPWLAKTKFMEFKEGGQRLYAMCGPEGEEHWALADFTSISPKTNFKFHFTHRLENTMQETNFRGTANDAIDNASTDVKSLVKDAQTLLTAAASLTGEKAEEMRSRGMKLLDSAMGKAGEYKTEAVIKGKQYAEATDVYVKDNPWRTVAVAAGVGLLLGAILGRK